MRTLRLLPFALLASGAWAQATHDSYWLPYQAWRQVAPALEQDAAAPTATFPDQVRKTGEAAQSYFDARVANYLNPHTGAAEQAAWGTRPLATADSLLTLPPEVQQLLAVAAAKAGTSVNSFAADDKDPVIRRMRQALERERATLRALIDSFATAKAPLTEMIDASDNAEIQRALVGQALSSAVARRTQLAEHVKREAADWTTYYKDLLEGATANGRTSTTSAAPSPAPAKIIRPAANGQVLLTRYIGEWIFPNKGLYYGPQPETVELVVQESNGNLRGTLTAKFITPLASLQFEFQGPVQPGKTQTFPVSTGGTVEFIPGSAFNLLEVNYQTPQATSSVSTANFVLVKR
ncbi:MAG: hypothetical protein ABIR70_04550 [Bryobacteraceae bacterium]